jgi:toluene monooxygenase system ferredoxin subunit
VSFRCAAELESLWPGEMRGVVIDAVKVLLVNVGGEVCAYADRCAHRAVELSRGTLTRETLTCAAHQWQYDARSGAGLNPRGVTLVRFPVKIEDDRIWVDTRGGAGLAAAPAALVEEEERGGHE